MTDPNKPDARSDEDVVIRSVRWRRDEWDKLERAALLLGEQEHLRLLPVDIIRSGALRRAEEIEATLGGHAGAACGGHGAPERRAGEERRGHDRPNHE